VPGFEDDDLLQMDGLLAAMEGSDVTPDESEPAKVDDSLDVAALKQSLADLAGPEGQATGPVLQLWRDAFGEDVNVMDVTEREPADGEDDDGFELSGTF
tara:strand:+ start:1330 stop:1626 length:297 start_codon:yes stop_codon:yes gene_type:complete